ncbi:hypothetical protein SESBI_26151 [Sesbania bispinosa]|nr:hypothetical protein SESBI_26151 [Sesbania bispinosa]
MGGLCSTSAKGDKAFAKTKGHSDDHKSAGEGLEKKKREPAADEGTGPDDFYDGIPRYTDSFPHKSRSVRSRQAAVAKSVISNKPCMPLKVETCCYQGWIGLDRLRVKVG